MDHTTPDSYKLLQSQHKDFLRGTHITDIYPRVSAVTPCVSFVCQIH